MSRKRFLRLMGLWSKGSEETVDGAFGPEGCVRLTAAGCVPRGETTHYILRVALLLHPLLSLTHWIFRSLMLPYKSSSLVQNVFAVHRFAQGATAAVPQRVVEAPYGRNIKSALRGLHLCHYGSLVISSGGTSRYESHGFVEPVKGSPEISLQNAACRQSVQHRVSFRHLTSYTPAPLRGPLSTGKRLTKFSVAFGSLQISFACHP